jgi:hypothetical protein
VGHRMRLSESIPLHHWDVKANLQREGVVYEIMRMRYEVGGRRYECVSVWEREDSR